MIQSSTFSEYAASLKKFVEEIFPEVLAGEEYQRLLLKPTSQSRFESLALQLFGLQFRHNAVYRRFCEGRRVTPENLKAWSDIPCMPTSAFKELDLTSIPEGERIRVFHSSGTTEQRPSRHFHSAESISIYEYSLSPWFWWHLLSAVKVEKRRFVALTPPPHRVPNSSLVHMFETVCREFKAESADFAGSIGEEGWSLDVEKTVRVLQESIQVNQPVLLMGTAFNFVHLLDALAERNLVLKLPKGSRVMETGGYKGRSRTMAREELHALITKLLGVPSDFIVCEYGMSELSSQAYDGKAGESRAGKRIFYFPPWARVQVVSPETGREVGEGETGLIRIFDLANVWSVMAIQTEDLGIRRGDGFELIGRAALAEPRGCSLAVI